MTKSEIATCFIVPSSFVTNRSAATSVVEVALVFPSIMFSSAVVTVAPSRISNSASEIAAEPIVIVPVKVGLAIGALAANWV